MEKDDKPGRVHVSATVSWLKKIDDWRRHQPDLPNVSEAVRRLVDLGLAAEASKKKRSAA